MMATKGAARTSGAVFGGVVAALVGVGLIFGGGAILNEGGDAEGFSMSEAYGFEASTRAIVSEDIALLNDASSALSDFVTNPGDLRVRSVTGSAKPLFIGVAATADVERYLAGAPYVQVTGVSFDGSSITGVETQTHSATAVPAPPGDQDIWVAWTAGDRPQTLNRSLESGNWSVVVMNSDASAGVAADLAFGAKPSNLTAIAWLAIAIGIALAIGGGYAMYRAMRPTEHPPVIDLDGEATVTEEQQLRKEPARTG